MVLQCLKEEKEKNKKEISDQLKALLKGYADLKAEVKRKEDELKKLENEKMKEFTKAAQQLFARVESMNARAQEFREGLGEATNAGS